jgi:predicted TIM-barrel fold metal-dependent hydrolase
VFSEHAGASEEVVDMTIIGIEEHWTTLGLTSALGSLPPERADDSLALNEFGDTLERLTDLDDGRLAAMDAQGIDVQVISLVPPGAGVLDPADAVAMSRDLNDGAIDAARRHPRRLRSMATLPLSDPAACAAELARAAALGHVGAMVYGRVGDRRLDDPAFDELFASAAELGAPIFIHPQIPPRSVRDAAYAGFDEMTELALATFGWGWHVEAATAALRLIARGTFDRHPQLQVVLGHWGELLPFWSDRTDSLARIAGLEKTVAETIRANFHLTCSGMLSPALLRHALEVTSVDRLLFSTDYPFQSPSAEDIERFLAGFETDEDRAAFTAGNAARLFGIDSRIGTPIGGGGGGGGGAGGGGGSASGVQT